MNAVLEGKIAKREGKSYYNFKTLDLDVKVGDYKVRLDGLFGENKALGELSKHYRLTTKALFDCCTLSEKRRRKRH